MKVFDFDLQVRTFYKNCNGKASCNCAVAVKVEDDVIVIDRCSEVKSRKVTAKPIQIRSYINGEVTPGLRVYRTGAEYRVRCGRELTHFLNCIELVDGSLLSFFIRCFLFTVY